jgi:hypothetical protein
MSTFIVRIELHPADQEQDYSAVHAVMEQAAFSRIYRADDGVRYHLPSSEYCISTVSTVEEILEQARHAARKITSQFMVLVSETTKIAVAGLVPVEHPVHPAKLPTTLPLQSGSPKAA